MNEKINIGQAITADPDGMIIQLNIDALLEALELPEVQLSIQHFVAKGNKKQRKIKIYVARLEPEFVNKYQTHSVRIDTFYKAK